MFLNIRPTTEHEDTVGRVSLSAAEAEGHRVVVRSCQPGYRAMGWGAGPRARVRNDPAYLARLSLSLQLKQKDVAELLTRADDLTTQQRSYQPGYGAMGWGEGPRARVRNDPAYLARLSLSLQLKQKDVAELLTRADDLTTQQRSYQPGYGAMGWGEGPRARVRYDPAYLARFSLSRQLKQKDVAELLTRADDLSTQQRSYWPGYGAMGWGAGPRARVRYDPAYLARFSLSLQLKQKDVAELLTRADDLTTQQRSYQQVYEAMAESLGEAWKDLNAQLEYRRMLLDQSINFHQSARQVGSGGGGGGDDDDVRQGAPPGGSEARPPGGATGGRRGAPPSVCGEKSSGQFSVMPSWTWFLRE